MSFIEYKEPRTVVTYHNVHSDFVSIGWKYKIPEERHDRRLFQIKLTVNLDDKTVESEVV